MALKINGIFCAGNLGGGIYIAGKNPDVEIQDAVVINNGGPGIEIDPSASKKDHLSSHENRRMLRSRIKDDENE